MILIHQSHPIVVTSMEKGIGPLRDQPYRFAHEVRQWPRRSEGKFLIRPRIPLLERLLGSPRMYPPAYL